MDKHYIQTWVDRHGVKQQNVTFPLEQHVSKIIITKDASNQMMKKLKNFNIPGEIVIKRK